MGRLFPKHGRPWDELAPEMEAAKADDMPWHSGRAHKTAFHASDEVLAVVKEAYSMFLTENALYPSGFKSLGRFEQEILRMAADILGGGPETAGICTSGGTESNIVAVKAARDHARVHRPQARRPEILLGRNAHPSFNKAADFMGLDVVRTPLGDDLRADPQAIAGAVNDNTIMIVGSAPAWPYGIIDPIAELADIARDHGLWCHVDSCVGGFIAPFVRKLGYDMPDFDLSVAGVWSISADLHKYGYAAKNISTLLFRDPGLRDIAGFQFDDWPSGRYATYTVSGSRTGGALAGAWAVLNHLGEDGYLDFARQSMDALDRLKAGIEAMDGLHIWGRPHATLAAYGSTVHDILAVAEAMERRGWIVNRLKEPSAIQLVINPIHAPLVDEYLADLAESLDEVVRGHNRAVNRDVSYAE